MSTSSSQLRSRSISSRPFLAFAIYCCAACLWIIFTDKLVRLTAHTPDLLITLSIAKGLLFVAISGGLLYFSLSKVARTNASLEAMVSERNSALIASDRELRESEDRFRRVVEGAPEGIYIQVDSKYRYLNPVALAMFGAERPDQLIGQSILERLHTDHRDLVVERDQALTEGRHDIALAERRFLRLDGVAFDAEVAAVPSTFDGQHGSIVFFRDITERKQTQHRMHVLEAELRQSQKMEAIGRLAGGIAHDFNNLLMVISSYAELVGIQLPDNDSLQKNLQAIRKATDRASSLTGQMLAFSRKQILSPVVVDLSILVEETAKMIRRLIGEDIELIVSTSGSVWPVEADADQIVQVVMNLCVNARDAMPTGGTLDIATRNVTVSNPDASVPPYVAAGDYVVLSVTDSGTGITAKVQEHMFEPFFTTKEVGKGTGLGLAMVYGIVRQSNGYVWADNVPGRGACFKVYLPRTAKAMATSLHQPETSDRGDETLLLVEDEDALRDALASFLRKLGYTVLTADSGHDALLKAKNHGAKLNLLITDVVMPKMSGRELSQQMESLFPDLKTIYMSGYTDDSLVRHGVKEAGSAFIQKPFNLESLAHKVREVIG
jgi:PAS domain S-box-containing protein